MPTENPKISAYVPQVVYDRFMRFKEEHDLSMSQAAIEIFAAYFGINLNPTVSNQSTSELQSRLEILEKALADLQESHFALSKKVDLMQSTGEPPSTKPVEVPVYKDAESEPDIGLHNELPKEDVVEQPIDTSIIDKPESSLDSELHKNNNARPFNKSLDETPADYFGSTLFGSSNSLLSELQSNPLQAKVLVSRLNKTNVSEISNKKGSLPLEEFFDWLRSKDRDGIRWVLIGEGKKARYIPASDTSPENLEKLKNWIQLNT